MDPGVQASDMRLNLVSNSSMPSQVFLGQETGWLHIVWLHHPHNTNISIGNNTDALRDFEGQLVESSQRIVQVSVIGQFGLSSQVRMENYNQQTFICQENHGKLMAYGKWMPQKSRSPTSNQSPVSPNAATQIQVIEPASKGLHLSCPLSVESAEIPCGYATISNSKCQKYCKVFELSNRSLFWVPCTDLQLKPVMWARIWCPVCCQQS